ncbi:S-layer homology domain-containing protein [Caloranaerobacter sp. TR13]|uniref:S-layer homology domain-containing protein n=1 Tax=Caloranaerobacter sp. TR13 TaxID=1302151 RepID=UPI00137930EE|nr:S-layer homology domain-containing protein [Caloranaerobacter sp. TR13]
MLVIIIGSILFVNQNVAYTENTPDVILYIHGEKSIGGPIFHQKGNLVDGYLAPGATVSGTLRIYNNYSERINVENLALTIKLEKSYGDNYYQIEDENLYEVFAKNMKLTIKRGRMLIFTKIIYNKSFYEMMYKKDNEDYNGYDLPILDRFNINKNDYIDLKYIVHMDERAGNELQGIKATVNFLINVNENPVYQGGSSYNPPSSGGGSRGNSKEEVDDEIQLEDENEKKQEVNVDFIDIKGHWAKDCIQTLIEHNIVNGYPDKTIRPDNFITRAEAAVLICRALNLEEKNKLFTGYIDSIPKWARGYVIASTEKGIFKGYPGRLFKASKKITRQEMIAVLMRGFNKELEEEIEINYIDKDNIQDWALRYVKTGVYYKIVNGYPDSTFKPNNNITRAEVFTMICKLLGYHNEHAS